MTEAGTNPHNRYLVATKLWSNLEQSSVHEPHRLHVTRSIALLVVGFRPGTAATKAERQIAGPSPRVWGKHTDGWIGQQIKRTIPTRVGLAVGSAQGIYHPPCRRSETRLSDS